MISIKKLLHQLKQNFSSIISYNTASLLKQIKDLPDHFIVTCIVKLHNNDAIIFKEYYHNHINTIISTNNNFKLSNESSISIYRRTYSFHKLLKIPQTTFNLSYLILIPKCHKNPIIFCTVITGCNTYSNDASKILLNILK